MKNKYARLAERLKSFRFEVSVLKRSGVVVERFTMGGYLRQSVQVVEQETRKSRAHLHVSVDVLDRIGVDNPRKASTYQVAGTLLDRYGRIAWPGDRYHDYEGWDYAEVDAIADVAEKFALPWLDSWNDPKKIIRFLLDDINEKRAAQEAWDEEASKKPTLWRRLRGQLPPDPLDRPRVPPGHILALADLYFYIGDNQEAAKYLEQVCAAQPRWEAHRVMLDKLQRSERA